MHASLKESLCGASSGSPDNALHSLVVIMEVAIYVIVKCDQEVFVGFRAQSLRAQSARVQSGLNSTNTDWPAFKYHRFKSVL